MTAQMSKNVERNSPMLTPQDILYKSILDGHLSSTFVPSDINTHVRLEVKSHHKGLLDLSSYLRYTVACEMIHPPWHFSFVALQHGLKLLCWKVNLHPSLKSLED